MLQLIWFWFFFFSFLIKNRISEQNYVEAIKEEINKVVKIQEELDIDVLVHGEPEVSFLLLNKIN